MVAVPARRSWRPFAMPAVFLLAATLVVFGVRVALHSSSAPTRPHVTHVTLTERYYRVRPGDTLASVAAKTGVSAARLRQLNPKLQPTALFVGQRIQLR